MRKLIRFCSWTFSKKYMSSMEWWQVIQYKEISKRSIDQFNTRLIKETWRFFQWYDHDGANAFAFASSTDSFSTRLMQKTEFWWNWLHHQSTTTAILHDSITADPERYFNWKKHCIYWKNHQVDLRIFSNKKKESLKKWFYLTKFDKLKIATPWVMVFVDKMLIVTKIHRWNRSKDIWVGGWR